MAGSLPPPPARRTGDMRLYEVLELLLGNLRLKLGRVLCMALRTQTGGGARPTAKVARCSELTKRGGPFAPPRSRRGSASNRTVRLVAADGAGRFAAAGRSGRPEGAVRRRSRGGPRSL